MVLLHRASCADERPRRSSRSCSAAYARGYSVSSALALTFADVAEEWYERGHFEQDWSASTRRDYRSILDAHLLPTFGSKRIETITTNEVEHWRDQLATRLVPSGDGKHMEKPRSRRTINKIVGQLHSVLQYATRHAGLATNPAAPIERLRESRDTTKRFDFYSPQDIDEFVAAAASGGHRDPRRPAISNAERARRVDEDRQDAAPTHRCSQRTTTQRTTGAALGRRRLRAVLDPRLQRLQRNEKGNTKSRKSRTVPMVDKVAATLKELKKRKHHTAKSDNVFVSRDGTPLDGSALRRRYIATAEAAGLRPLRFHDLRHTFGSLAINVASIVQVQAWLGHADVKTTMRYRHHKSRAVMLSCSLKHSEANKHPNRPVPTELARSNPTGPFQPNRPVPTQPARSNPTGRFEPNPPVPTQPARSNPTGPFQPTYTVLRPANHVRLDAGPTSTAVPTTGSSRPDPRVSRSDQR